MNNLTQTHTYIVQLVEGRHQNTFREQFYILKNQRLKNSCLIFLEFSHEWQDFFSQYSILGKCSDITRLFFLYKNIHSGFDLNCCRQKQYHCHKCPISKETIIIPNNIRTVKTLCTLICHQVQGPKLYPVQYFYFINILIRKIYSSTSQPVDPIQVTNYR